MNILVEKPLGSKGTDEFEYKNYLEAFSKVIMSTETPFTISIQGEWGSGKTSFVNLVHGQLEKEHKGDFKFINFSMWDYSQFKGRSLSEFLLKDLISKVVSGKEGKFEAYRTVSRMSDIFRKTLEYGLQHILSSAGTDVDEVLDLVTDYHEGINVVTPIDDVQKFRGILSKNIGNTRHIIFIDDLDRINPDEVIEILEALQIFLTVNNCVFILAVDYDVIIQGYKNKFGESFNLMKSKNFFDKIIQLPFSLPEIDSQIGGRFVGKLLNKVPGIKIVESEKKQIIDIFKNSVGFNPREVKRLVNSYWLSLELYENKEEIDIESSIYFACMQSEYPDLYRFIRRYSSEDTQDDRMLSDFIKTINSKGIERWMEISDKSERTIDSKKYKMYNEFNLVIQNIQIEKDKELGEITQTIDDFFEFFSMFFEGVTERFNDKFYKAITFNKIFDVTPNKDEVNGIARVVIHLNDNINKFIQIKETIEKDARINNVLKSVYKEITNNKLTKVIIEFDGFVSNDYRWKVIDVLNENEISRNRVTTHKDFYKI